MRLLKKGEALEEGDLIWYNGHVMIVSDIKKNRLLRHAGYESGWGKVHEIALDKVFNRKGMVSSLHPITIVLFCDGSLTEASRIAQSISLKIYKLKSIWEATG